MKNNKSERMKKMEENTEDVVMEELEKIEVEEDNGIKTGEEENGASKIEEMNKKGNDVTLTRELADTTDRLKRVMADYENYKKRNEKEREQLYNSLLGDIVSSMLPVIDNLEKAVEVKTEDEGYKQGIELLLKQFLDVLASFGVEAIKSVGELFDPELHEAVSSVQDEALGEKIIKEEFRKGYKIGSKIIRHAMVVVAN